MDKYRIKSCVLSNKNNSERVKCEFQPVCIILQSMMGGREEKLNKLSSENLINFNMKKNSNLIARAM